MIKKIIKIQEIKISHFGTFNINSTHKYSDFLCFFCTILQWKKKEEKLEDYLYIKFGPSGIGRALKQNRQDIGLDG
jgi:hypothetical protein